MCTVANLLVVSRSSLTLTSRLSSTPLIAFQAFSGAATVRYLIARNTNVMNNATVYVLLKLGGERYPLIGRERISHVLTVR